MEIEKGTKMIVLTLRQLELLPEVTQLAISGPVEYEDGLYRILELEAVGMIVTFKIQEEAFAYIKRVCDNAVEQHDKN